jgi:hypothetical protein
MPANIAAKETIVIGFVSVRKNVEPYAPKSPALFSEGDFSDGLTSRVFAPKRHRKTPPNKRSHSCCWMSVSEMKVKPNAATHPYMASAVAAPKPEISPWSRPSASVRRIHSTPIGPTGAAIEKPIMRPLTRKCKFKRLFLLVFVNPIWCERLYFLSTEIYVVDCHERRGSLL